MQLFAPFPPCHSPHHRRRCHKSQTQAGSGSLPEPSRETFQPKTCVLYGSRTWMPQNHKSGVIRTKLRLFLQQKSKYFCIHGLSWVMYLIYVILNIHQSNLAVQNFPLLCLHLVVLVNATNMRFYCTVITSLRLRLGKLHFGTLWSRFISEFGWYITYIQNVPEEA